MTKKLAVALLLAFAPALLSAATTTDDEPLRIGGDVQAPVLLSKVNAVYPAEARRSRVQGEVTLEAIIDKTGSPRDIKVLKGLPLGLSQAAVDALQRWKFKPGTRNGEPVDVLFNVTMNFFLDRRPKLKS